MRKKLAVQSCTKFLAGVILTAALLFLPAGTLDWQGGWLLMALVFLPMLAGWAALLWKAPDLLERRLRAKEPQRQQRGVILASGLMFLVGFPVCGLDYRFGWSRLPGWGITAASAVLLAGYLLFAGVLRENRYLSRTVEVQTGQTLVDTGLYGIVRHPMYSATLLLFCAMPLVLGSLWGFLVFLAYPPILAARIANEEKILCEGLPGYREYTARVRWRLVPLLW